MDGFSEHFPAAAPAGEKTGPLLADGGAVRPDGGAVLPAVLHSGRRLFPLCWRFQQPADQLLPVYERLCQGAGLPGQPAGRGGVQYVLLGHGPGQRCHERLFVLPVRLAVFLVLADLPAAVAALPDGAAAGAQVCRGGRRRVPLPAPLCAEREFCGAGGLPVYVFRLFGLQHLLQPLH